MTDEKIRVMCYTPEDEKLFLYNFTEEEAQETATTFMNDIWFVMTDAEIDDYLQSEPVDNLKLDFIWFRPGINKRSVMECTCGQFLESTEPTESGHEWLAKKAIAHSRKTGHQLNPRGN